MVLGALYRPSACWVADLDALGFRLCRQQVRQALDLRQIQLPCLRAFDMSREEGAQFSTNQSHTEMLPICRST